MLAEQSSQFVLKAHLVVMLLLPGYVANHLFQIGLADTKVRITALPLKIELVAGPLFQPEIGNPFDFLHPFRLSNGASEAAE